MHFHGYDCEFQKSFPANTPLLHYKHCDPAHSGYVTDLENLWKFLGTFLWVPYYQNMIEWVPMTQGFNPYFILGSNTYFLRCDIDF